MFQKYFSSILIIAMILAFALSADAQRKKPKVPAKKKATPTTEIPKEEPIASEKKNSRPETDEAPTETPVPGKKNSKSADSTVAVNAKQTSAKSVYFYEFSRPGFVVEKIWIDHDESGNGTIRFMKMYYDDEISDPLILSPATADRVRTLWQNLNFLDSIENYQYEKDYSHLGNLKFTMKKDARERIAEFNWTSHADAKALADEYRKISNQYLWMFDMNLSRENQPLESSKIINSLDSQIQRNEIADPEQMLPYLKELGDDERIPLLSRNHAKRIVGEIEKKLAKKKDDKQ
jgi:hypothetical protein